MKKTLAIVLCISMLLGMLSMLSLADTATVVEKGSDWNYVVYEDTATEAPEGWLTGAEAIEWTTAPAPFSGTAFTNPNAVTTLPYGNYRCYMYQEFTLDAAATASTMYIMYDEQPVVYINGTEVWDYTDNTATSNNYVDHMYVEVDLSAYADSFKEGTNVIAVDWRNEYGGSVMDLQLDVVTDGDTPVVPPVVDNSLINEDGTVKIENTESFDKEGNPGQCPFGSNCACGNLGGVAHLYDNDTGSVWGWGNAGSVIATFKGEVKVTEIFLQTKDEGSMIGDTAPHGEYVVSFLVDGEWYELGVVQALIEGKTVAVENVEATAIKVEIKDWYNTNWRSIAELTVKGEEIEGGTVTPPVEPPVVETKGNVTDTITWEIVDGVLTIDGTGEMPDFTVGEGNDTRPYAEYAATVTKVIVKGGVTKTGGRSFQGFSAMTELVLEEGVTTIAQDLASSCPVLETLTIPASVTSIGQGIVFGTDNIKTVNYGGADQAAFEAIAKANDYNYGYEDGTGGFAKVTNWVYNYTAESEQPITGDATVYAIVFAVVALMGMGVVVTKKVRA